MARHEIDISEADKSDIYYLLIKLYDDPSKTQLLLGVWDHLIKVAMGASLVSNMIWTRHSSVGGVVRSTSFYSDMYNEGIIVIADKEQIETFK